MLTYEDQYKLAGEIGAMRAHIAWLTEYDISEKQRMGITLKLKTHIQNCDTIICPQIPMPNNVYVSDNAGELHDLTDKTKHHD